MGADSAFQFNAITPEDRKPIWILLSELYLDIEFEEYYFKQLAQKISESPYSLNQVKKIKKKEVFPLLFPSLLSVAGV